MGSARKQYIINDTSVILESSPDTEMPTVRIHIDKNAHVPPAELLKLKLGILKMLVKAYNAVDFPAFSKQFDTSKSIGYQISYGSKDDEIKPTPDEFFSIAREWLEHLQTNVRTSGNLEDGLALTMRDIQLKIPAPDSGEGYRSNDGQRQATPLKCEEYMIGDVHYQIEETHSDRKFLFSFHDDMHELPNIKEIAAKMQELFSTVFPLQGIAITTNTTSDGLGFTIKTAEDIDIKHFFDRCNSLHGEINILANHNRDVIKGIDERIQQIQKADRINTLIALDAGITEAVGNLPGLSPEMLANKKPIAEAVLRAIFEPYADNAQAGIDAIQAGKGAGSDTEIKKRIKAALVEYVPADAQAAYYAGELANALYNAFPKKESVQER